MCRELAPEVVMAFLNDLFSRLDTLTNIYGVYKVSVCTSAADRWYVLPCLPLAWPMIC